MPISERSARIHALYRQWLQWDNRLAAAADAHAPPDTAVALQRDQTW